MKQTLPLMTIRDSVLFPGTDLSVQIARPFTLASVRHAIKNGGLLVVATQRLVEQNDAPALEQVFTAACLCRITDHVEFPDDSMKLRVVGEARVEIEALQDVDGIRHGLVETRPWLVEEKISSPDRYRLLDLAAKLRTPNNRERLYDLTEALKRVDDLPEFASRLAPLMYRSTAQAHPLTLEEIKEGVFRIDTLSGEEKIKINVGLARINELLAEDTAAGALAKMTALLDVTT